MHWKIIAPLALCLVQICPTVRAQNVIDPQVRFVASGIEDSRQKIKCGQGEVARQQLIPKEAISYLFSSPQTDDAAKVPDASKDRQTTQTGWWALKDSSLSMFVNIDRGDPSEVMKSQRFVSDGRSARTLDEYEDRSRPNRGAYYIGTISSLAETMPNGFWKEWEKLDPRFYAYSDFGIPLDQLLLQSNPPAVAEGEESLFGSRCIKISLFRSPNLRDVFWIDMDHGFMIRRIENQLVGKNERFIVMTQLQTSQITQSDGVWLPSDVEIKSYLPTQINPQGEFVGRPITEHFTLSNWKSDCNISPQIFSSNWPLRTDLRDTIQTEDGLVLTLSPQDLEDLSLGRQQRLQNVKSASKGLPPNNSIPANPKRNEQEQKAIEDRQAAPKEIKP